MNERRPFAPPLAHDETVATDTFDDIPSDKELDFSDRSRTDDFGPLSGDDEYFEDEGEGLFDDDLFIEDEDAPF